MSTKFKKRPWLFVKLNFGELHDLKLSVLHLFDYFFFIGIHSMQGWTATERHGIGEKQAQED